MNGLTFVAANFVWCWVRSSRALSARNAVRKHLVTAAALAAALASSAAARAGTTIVSNVDDLYTEVNNSENAGATIVLAPGRYVLSAIDGTGTSRRNGGRLELQKDMSLVGVVGNRAAVIIDASALPNASFRHPLWNRTGVIRVGRGSNTIAWLTIAGNANAAAAVDTDLVERDPAGNPMPTAIEVAHVVAGDSARGVDIRNVTEAMAGRRIKAEIEDNDFFQGVEGIRVANFMGADRGEIAAIMLGNRSYRNVEGCIIANNRSSFANVAVQSYGDRFDDNGAGCEIDGALVSSSAATSSTTRFDAYGSEFTNNTRIEFYNTTGPDLQSLGFGLAVAGAELLATATANTASNNTAIVRLSDAIFAGNLYFDVLAFGARSFLDPPAPAGTNDHSLIQLRGSSAGVAVVALDSQPPDPTGTNTVTVVRIP